MDLDHLRARLRPLQMMWASFFSTLAVYAVVLLVAADGSDPTSPVPLAMSGLGAALFPVVGIVRYQLLGPTLGLVVPSDLRVEQHVEGPALDKAAGAAMTRYFTGSIAGFALSEAVAILGLLSSFLTGDLRWYGGHAIFAALLLLVQVPRLSGVMALLSGPERKGMRRVLEGWQ